MTHRGNFTPAAPLLATACALSKATAVEAAAPSSSGRSTVACGQVDELRVEAYTMLETRPSGVTRNRGSESTWMGGGGGA